MILVCKFNFGKLIYESLYMNFDSRKDNLRPQVLREIDYEAQTLTRLSIIQNKR